VSEEGGNGKGNVLKGKEKGVGEQMEERG